MVRQYAKLFGASVIDWLLLNANFSSISSISWHRVLQVHPRCVFKSNDRRTKI